MEITIEEIQKKFEELPEDLRWAIMAANVDDKIIDIGKKNNLTVEQMGQLSLETHMVMFGFVHPDKFEESLKGSMKLAPETIRGLVKDINENILKNIRQNLIDLHNQTKEKEAEEDDHEILKKAGIEIINNEKTSPVTPVPSISIQRLSGSVQSRIINTDHTLNNISKPAGETKQMLDMKVPSTPVPTSYVDKKDPYRLSPDE